MEKHREIKIDLTWHFDGKFEATVVNGQIQSLNMCELGANGECGRCLTSSDIKFLENVHTALGELFKVIEEEQKSNGHSFSKETVN